MPYRGFPIFDGDWWLLLLAALMLLCFGEEISWGQRIFGWGTPSVFKALNSQHETSIHNIWIFQAKEPDGSRKTGLALLINPNRLLSMFWLAYCVAVPLITMVSTKASQTVKFFGFPVARFAAGTLFILNFAIFRFVVTYGSMDRDTVAAFDELKETNYEFAFMVLAICFLTHIVSSPCAGVPYPLHETMPQKTPSFPDPKIQRGPYRPLTCDPGWCRIRLWKSCERT